MSRLKACNHEQFIFGNDTRKVIIEKLIEYLKDRVDEFDAIAVSGYSSTIIASIVANALDKNILLVRKPSEQRYSNREVEGYTNQRVIFIDDCIDSGATLRRIRNGCDELDCQLVGVVLYYSYSDSGCDEIWHEFCIEDIIDGENYHNEYHDEEENKPVATWSVPAQEVYTGWSTLNS